MFRISQSVCLVVVASLFLAMGTEQCAMGTEQCAVQDEAALLQKEASLTIRAPEEPEEEPQYETDEDGVMHMPKAAKVHQNKLPTTKEQLAPDDDKKYKLEDFQYNQFKNDQAKEKPGFRSEEQQKEYDKFIKTPNRPGHVHYKPGTLFIPEKDSAKMQQAFLKGQEMVTKAKQVKKNVVAGLEKAEEMVMVSMPSLDEVSAEMVEEDETEKYHGRGGSKDTGRRRRITLDEALPEWAKKKAAELPDKVMERRAKQQEQQEEDRKIWDLQSSVGSVQAMKERQRLTDEKAKKRIKSIGEVISKWTTTTEKPPEVAPIVDDSDKSGGSMISLATWLNLLLLFSAMYSSS